MSSSKSCCAACKQQKKKCARGCVFAPYFPPAAAQKFADVHTVFGAKKVAEVLNEVAVSQRGSAMRSLAYEAEKRIEDPVGGCYAIILRLEQELWSVKQELSSVKQEQEKGLRAFNGQEENESLSRSAAAAEEHNDQSLSHSAAAAEEHNDQSLSRSAAAAEEHNDQSLSRSAAAAEEHNDLPYEVAESLLELKQGPGPSS